jgi:phosphoadenosine phosphosulfate reductase
MLEIEKLSTLLAGQSPVDALQILANKFANEIVFSTSLGIEDQVISDMILANNIPIKIFTLDTGRQFEETYKTLQQTRHQYNTDIKVYAPAGADVEQLVAQKGPYSFYESVENRKECCFVRKVKPLNRALSGNKIWITGIRAEQSANRQEMNQLEWDEAHQLFKFHPILNWTFDETKTYIKQNNVPYNVLHDRGFVSIGCSPCTRAIREGDDFRAGRWWWEDQSKKECGLH